MSDSQLNAAAKTQTMEAKSRLTAGYRPVASGPRRVTEKPKPPTNSGSGTRPTAKK